VGMTRTALQHNAPANDPISYAGYRFPPDVISYAVWLYYRFPLSLRMVEELLAALTACCLVSFFDLFIDVSSISKLIE